MRTVPARGADVVALYEQALPGPTFLAACAAPPDGPLTTSWLIGVARHKLADHWRWKGRQERLVDAIGPGEVAEDPWEQQLDVLRARQALERLGGHHRAALTLRYLDGLSVPETAAVLDRSLHATEALLVWARKAFRVEYEGASSHA